MGLPLEDGLVQLQAQGTWLYCKTTNIQKAEMYSAGVSVPHDLQITCENLKAEFQHPRSF